MAPSPSRLDIGLITALAGLRAVLVALVEPRVFPDSSRYRLPEDPMRVFRVDLAQGPGVLNQLLYMLPLQAAVVLQAVLAGLLWGAAAWVATRGLSRVWFAAALVFSLSPWWTAFDPAVLSESLSLAGMALFAAGAVSWMRGHGAGPLVVGAVVTLLSRPLAVPLVIGVLVVVVVARRALPGKAATGALVVSMLFAAAQSVAFSTAVADFRYLPEPTSMAGIQATDRMGTRGASEDYRELTERFGMPDCPAAHAVAERPKAPHTLRRLDCPGMKEWFAAGGVPWWAEVVHAPGETAETMGEKLATSTTYAPYAPAEWGPLVSPRVAKAGSWVMWGITIVAALSLLWPGRRWVARALLVGGVVSYGVLLTLVDGLEPWRHMTPALAAVVPLALAALPRPTDVARGRRSPRNPHDSGGRGGVSDGD